MKAQAKISVIIPVYNAEKYLGECLDSVIRQSVKEIEIICVDDGSTDSSGVILGDYAQKDSRIVVINQSKNSGAGISRNLGMDKAGGEYLHFLDADDYLVEHAYENLYIRAKEYDLDLTKARAYGIDAATGGTIEVPRYSMATLSSGDFNRVTNLHNNPALFMNVAVTPWSGLYKRSFVNEHNLHFYDLTCVNDRSFYVSVIINARAVMFVDQYLLVHRTNIPTSLVGRRAQHFDCHFKSYEIIEQLCAKLPVKTRSLILESEINDMFVWYRKFQNEHIFERQIYEQTKEFIRNLDVSDFEGGIEKCRWYKQYCELIEKQESGSCTGFRGLFRRMLK